MLQFNSNADDGVNATLNLLNKRPDAQRVARIIVSDSQTCGSSRPNGRSPSRRSRLHLRRRYPGRQAALLRQGILLHYDPFTIDLLNVDSVGFLADSRARRAGEDLPGGGAQRAGKRDRQPATIDEPSNKGGCFEKYPSSRSSTAARNP